MLIDKMKTPPRGPRKSKGGVGGRRPSIGRQCAPPLLQNSFAGGPPMSSADLQAKGVDAHPKAIGDACGHGERGLGLTRDHDDRYEVSQENAVRTIKATCKTDAQLEQLAKEAGQADAAAMIDA